MEVKINFSGGMKFEAECANHKVIVDLPKGLGGSDDGATPPQLFLTSLASCVGVYVVIYCNKSKIDTTGMQINISAQKVSAPMRLEDIKIDISLPNATVGDKRDKLLSAAKMCLIHNTIANHPKMEIALVTD